MFQADTLHTDNRVYENQTRLFFYSYMNHIQVFTHTIFANISTANFRNLSFTGQSLGKSERTYSSRLN